MSREDGLLILGINAAYHESSAALIQGDQIVLAVEEERLTRVKHAKIARVSNPDTLPWNAIKACLDAAGGLMLADLDAIAYSLVPGSRLAMIDTDPYPIGEEIGFGTEKGEHEFNNRVLTVPGQLARAANDLSVADRVRFIPHHLTHAASAFYGSPFEQAALLVVDGIGERATAWLGRGTPASLECIEEILYPHSIGMLWERVAVFLGFTEYDACKIMGLAAYGDPTRFVKEFDKLFRIPNRNGRSSGLFDPPFVIDPTLARFRSSDVSGLETLFGPQRRPDEAPETTRFADVAAALQRRTEEALLTLCCRLVAQTDQRNLVYSGGVALNCVANTRIEREGPFDSMYIQGAAHDAGTALGAALIIANERSNGLPRNTRIPTLPLTPFLGPSYDDARIDAAIERAGFMSERIPDPAIRAAALLAGGHIVGWFQGRLEFGPRALGNRSLLADPRHRQTRDELNRRIKHRESFRPFAASILEEDARDWFDLPTDRPGAGASRELMLLTYPVRSDRANLVPAVLHHDQTCRLQTVNRDRCPLFHALISNFRDLTGIPMVLNTSFNDQEPLTATPEDALATFARTRIDALFLGDRLVRRVP